MIGGAKSRPPRPEDEVWLQLENGSECTQTAQVWVHGVHRIGTLVGRNPIVTSITHGLGEASIACADFEDARCQGRSSVSPGDLKAFDEWNKDFGSFQNAEANAAA